MSDIMKELDKVVVSLKEFNQIRKTKVYEHLNDKLFFPLKSFVISIDVLKNKRLLFVVELDDYNPTMGGRIYNEEKDIDIIYKRTGKEKGVHIDAIGISQDDATTVYLTIIGVLVYICINARKRIERVSPKVTRQERENYVYRERECYLLNDIVKYTSIHPNKSAIKYRCEVWGVRGHIRHLKNGGTTFIKPYLKGKKRDILKPKNKTYMLYSDNDNKDGESDDK